MPRPKQLKPIVGQLPRQTHTHTPQFIGFVEMGAKAKFICSCGQLTTVGVVNESTD